MAPSPTGEGKARESGSPPSVMHQMPRFALLFGRGSRAAFRVGKIYNGEVPGVSVWTQGDSSHDVEY
jgi:hypothetical protein